MLLQVVLEWEYRMVWEGKGSSIGAMAKCGDVTCRCMMHWVQ